MTEKRPMVILTGPTAVGKTALSIELAKKINGSIISADSMQVYRHMDIGSAKVMPEEMNGVKHYLIDEFEPDEEFHVVKFVERAKEHLEEIYAEEKIPIIAGGTGFYIQALLYDIDFTEQVPFKNAAESPNLFVKVDKEMTAAGKTPVAWNFSTMPSENWKNGVGSALTAYAAGTGSWDDVVTAFVDGWASEAALNAAA